MVEKNINNTSAAPILKDQRGKMSGVVVNNVKAHEGTVTVLVKRSFRHKKYHKIITTSKKYLCEYKDRGAPIAIGTQVVLRQIAPISKRKYNMIESIKEVK
jgi:ribosomal protein S17